MFPTQQELHNHITDVNYNQYTNPDHIPFALTETSPGLECYSSSNTFYDELLHNGEDSNNDMPSKRYLSKSERRAEHNAIERARRENLNTKFQSLAQLLPNLINYRRPSKSQIVEKTLEWVQKSISKDERQRYQILQLQIENKRLMTQCISQQQEQHQPYRPQNQNSYQQQENTPIIPHDVSNNNNVTIIGPNTTANYTSPTPNMYSNDLVKSNSWIIQSQFLDPHSRVSAFSLADEIEKQDHNPKSDYNSVNEDDINYQHSPYAFTESLYIQRQLNKQRQQLMVPELNSTGTKSWNQQEDVSQKMDGKKIDPGINGRSRQF